MDKLSNRIGTGVLVGGLYLLVNGFLVANAITPKSLDLEHKVYSGGFSEVLPENTLTNRLFASWNLRSNPSIVLNDMEEIVLNEDAAIPKITTGYNNCYQDGILQPSQVTLYSKKEEDSFKTSPEVPKHLKIIFEENGLCNYRPVKK